MNTQDSVTMLQRLHEASNLKEAKKILSEAGSRENNFLLNFLDDFSIYGRDALNEAKKTAIQLRSLAELAEFIDRELLDRNSTDVLQQETTEDEADSEIKTFACVLHSDLLSLLEGDENTSIEYVSLGAASMLEILKTCLEE